MYLFIISKYTRAIIIGDDDGDWTVAMGVSGDGAEEEGVHMHAAGVGADDCTTTAAAGDFLGDSSIDPWKTMTMWVRAVAGESWTMWRSKQKMTAK